MGSNRVDRGSLQAGDHIYTYNVPFFSHHGIYVGDGKVIHFVSRCGQAETSRPSNSLFSSEYQINRSDLDKFISRGALYRFKYSVSVAHFLTSGTGSCTVAPSDPNEIVVGRAEYILEKQNFGCYGLFKNNCEDFAIYCKTELLVIDQSQVGQSGQSVAFVSASFSIIATSLLVIPSVMFLTMAGGWAAMVAMAALAGPAFLVVPVGCLVAAPVFGLLSYFGGRYNADISRRIDAVKVPKEQLIENLATGKFRVFDQAALDRLSQQSSLIRMNLLRSQQNAGRFRGGR